jgi:uncharacterized membrane protein
MTRWRWLFTQLTRKLWLRTTAYALLGVVTAVLAIATQHVLPWELPELGADAVDSLLNIIASSMLAVTTFSLSAMTAAYSAATSNVTPRATNLLIEDRVTQRVLSTFVGSFVFAIVGIIVLRTGAYGPSGRTVLFCVTIIVVILIVVNLLHWIDHITRLGRVGETTDRVEQATRTALEERLASPYLGGVPLQPNEAEPPADALVIPAGHIGYLQYIDMTALSDIAEAHDCDIHVLRNPGAFVSVDTPLAWMRVRASDEGTATEIAGAALSAFITGDARSFDQDPRFGLAVMSEIGSRALSPATNDPGTALDVIGRNTRLIALWARGPEETETEHPRIHVAPLNDADLFEDAFMLLARDGAGLVEVQLRLQKCLNALSRIGNDAFRAAARHQARMALARAEGALRFAADLDRLRDDS